MLKTHRRLRLLLALVFCSPSNWCEARTQPGFQEILRDVLPAVVHIQSSERPLRPPAYLSPEQYFFKSPSPQGASVFPLGTGFLIKPQGYCVTSYQVIDGAQSFEVITADKRRIKASLLGGDRTIDLAVLKLEGAGRIATLDFADSDKAGLGDPLLLIGQGMGFQPFLSSGMLAAKGHVLGSGPYDRHFVLDFVTHPGNAGGPVIDSRGRVVGLASYVDQGPPHLGFALPSKLLQTSLRELIRHGKVLRAWLGMVGKSLTSMENFSEVHDSNVRAGVLVENLIVDAPAAQSGLQVGDLVVAAADKPLRDFAQLQDLLTDRKAGEQLTLKIYRRKQGFVTIKVLLGAIPSATDLPVTDNLL